MDTIHTLSTAYGACLTNGLGQIMLFTSEEEAQAYLEEECPDSMGRLSPRRAVLARRVVAA